MSTNVLTDEAQLVELSTSWSTAMTDRNEDKLEELMAPDFMIHKWDNTRDVPRAKWFDFFFNHIKITEFEQTAIAARVYGDVGVVTSKFPIMRATFDDKPMGELHGYFTDVWRRADGKWQVVSRTSADIVGRENLQAS